MSRTIRALYATVIAVVILLIGLALAMAPAQSAHASARADCFFRFIGEDCIDQQGERYERRQNPTAPRVRECYIFCPAGPRPKVERPAPPQFDWLQPRGGGPRPKRQQQQDGGDGGGRTCGEFLGVPLRCPE